MFLLDFPDHILVCILSFLPIKSQLLFSSTCSKLRELLFYPTLWANFKLITDRRLKRDQASCAESLLDFFQKVPAKSVSAITWKLDHEYFGVLKTVCYRNKNLRYLQIVDEFMKNEDVEFLCSTLTNLAHLGITGASNVTGKCLQYFEQLPCLSSLG